MTPPFVTKVISALAWALVCMLGGLIMELCKVYFR